MFITPFNHELEKALKQANSDILIICPFIKETALQYILDTIPMDVSVNVIVRWKSQDLLQGVSDLSIFDIVKNRGGYLRRHPFIHLKLIIIDSKVVIFGSANITSMGLGLAPGGNIESIGFSEFESSKSGIENIVNGSFEVDLELLLELKEALKNAKKEENILLNSIERELNSALRKNSTRQKELVVADMIFTSSPRELLKEIRKGGDISNDLLILDVTASEIMNSKDPFNLLKKKFLKSKPYVWQRSVVSERVSFGKYSELLHSSLSDSPKPYRKQVKDLVKNMFSWTRELDEKCIFEKYNYTESMMYLED